MSGLDRFSARASRRPHSEFDTLPLRTAEEVEECDTAHYLIAETNGPVNRDGFGGAE